MIRASHILFWFGLSIAASIALYHTSDRVQELDKQLRDINTAIEGEQQTIHVLKAEWVYLANPARVETEARRHLSLHATEPGQVIALADLGDALPTHEETMASVTVAATPIASVKTSLAVPPPAPARKIAIVAANNHINDRMIIQRDAVATARQPDQIGTLINELGSRP